MELVFWLKINWSVISWDYYEDYNDVELRKKELIDNWEHREEEIDIVIKSDDGTWVTPFIK